jgi:hypothetical protein
VVSVDTRGVAVECERGANYFPGPLWDANPGTTRRKPWRSLEKANAKRFQPGDRVLFRAGSTWSGQLLL